MLTDDYFVFSQSTRLTEVQTDKRPELAFRCALTKQDAQLSQRDRAAGCVTVFAKSRRLELGDNILRTL